MAGMAENGISRNSARISRLVDEMTLFDDDLMSRVFDENIEATEYVLRIILGRKIKVVRVKGQEDFKNPVIGGRNIILDVHAIDKDGQEIDIEVQCSSAGAHIRRARFHSSMTDSRMLKENQNFKELKDSYVIFIYKHDKFGKGLPIYHVNRHIEETGERFADGSHIIYVNGSYKGNDEIGNLMHDFHQSDANKINSITLAKSVRNYKESEGGQKIMCDAVEKFAKEYAEEYAKEKEINMLVTFLTNGGTTEAAKRMLKASDEDIILAQKQIADVNCNN